MSGPYNINDSKELSGSMLFLPPIFPVDIQYAGARYLRTGNIETDTAKFDTDLWANSIATYWTDSYSTPAAIGDIAGNNAGVVIAVLSGGTAGNYYRSTDGGVNWSLATLPSFGSANFPRAAAWIDRLGLFIVAGDNGILLTSPDGQSWTPRTSNFGTSAIFAVEDNGTTAVIVGAAGKIATSTNGTAWTARTSGIALDLSCVAFCAGVWLACSNSMTNGSVRSTDSGLNWSAVTVNPSASATISAIATDGTKFVVTVNTIGLYQSTNGVSWALSTNKVGFQAFAFLSYADGHFYSGPDSTTAVYAKSKDLINWTFFHVDPYTVSVGSIRKLKRLGASYFVFGSNNMIRRGNGYKYAGWPFLVRNNQASSSNDTPTAHAVVGYIKV